MGSTFNRRSSASRSQLQMNDIAEVEFDTSLPLFFDAYAANREMGALILIDPVTNATVGAAMIIDAVEPLEKSASQARAPRLYGCAGCLRSGGVAGRFEEARPCCGDCR